MRKVYVLPNLFTSASLFCGVLAILNVFNVADAPSLETHHYALSCWLILAASVLDLLDGLVARMTRSESLFGAQFDSLADVVAFGVAPAVLVYTRMVRLDNRQAAEFIATLFPIFGALRLARFNVQKTKVEKKSFTGMPIPGAAGLVVSAFLFFQVADSQWEDRPIILGLDATEILSGLMVLASVLMVSTVSYPSFKQLHLERRRPFDLLPILITLAAFGIFFKNHLQLIVFLGFLTYTFIGLLGAAAQLVRPRRPSGRGPRVGEPIATAPEAAPGPASGL